MPYTEIVPAEEVAKGWASWCGSRCQWVKKLTEFGELGGKCRWWCGYPRSRSAIPLTFELFSPSGEPLPCEHRLKDIRTAIAALEGETDARTPTKTP